MFDPIQYMIAMESTTKHSVNERRSILDNIEDKEPGTVEKEVASFKKAAENMVKIAEDAVKKADIPGIAVYINTKMFEEIDSLSLLPSTYVDKMNFTKCLDFLDDADNYKNVIDGEYISFEIYNFSSSKTAMVKTSSKYGFDKNPKSSASGKISTDYNDFVENLYNRLKGNTNFWGLTYSGEWSHGAIGIILKASDRFLSIARKYGY